MKPWPDRLLPALGIVAAAFLVAAFVYRPQPLPEDAARYHLQSAPAAGDRSAAAGVTFAFDTLEVDGAQEAVSDPKPVTSRAQVILHGWAVDPRTLAPVRRLLVGIDGQHLIAVSGYGMPRPDVAAAVAPSALDSGFAIPILTAGLPPGRHSARIVLDEADGKQLALPAEVTFTIAQSPAKIPS
jgi:hypothetical protein